ncbi:PI-PLC X domain-containing protein 1-like [Schistocerca cancellata]|uniref:PI-PLC X domain-containing protein 1-like n=1 Tax=Schistocerca cancellata TaxID=274614 RepID=UPI002117A27D|nr:PI-PLC X domain-containing protein 1-like [Schistocerca cancellata]
MRADVKLPLPLLLLLLLATWAPLAAARSTSLRDKSAELRAAQAAPRTGITVSAQVSASPQRPYVVWWEGATADYWLCLWDRDPRAGDATPLARLDLGAGQADQSGWWDTGIAAADSHSEPPSYEATDLGRWAGLVPRSAGDVSSSAVGVSSLATRPRWMEQSRAQLGPLPLTALFLPGTHDSGAYKLFSAADAAAAGSAALPRETLIDKYSVAQEESVLWQLAFGVRYLDLRVAYYPLTDEVWWLNHGLVRFRPLADVLQQVLTFVENTQEVVVLDFHEFPVGFRQQGRRLGSVHDQLVAELRTQLGAVAALPTAGGGGWAATLDQLWAGGRRLVVSYNDATTVAGNADFLWSAVSQKWGDVRTLDDLHDYLQGLYLSPPTGPWAAMAELTPNTMDVLLDRLGGLRKMADLVNKNVTAWYRGKWGQTVNAVAVDFFQGTAIVEAAIEWNLQRAAEARKANVTVPLCSSAPGRTGELCPSTPGRHL